MEEEQNNRQILKEVLDIVIENHGSVVSKSKLRVALNEQGRIVVDKITQEAVDLVIGIATYYILLMLWSESAQVRMPHVDIPKDRPEWKKRFDILEPVGYGLARDIFVRRRKHLAIQ